MFQSIKFYSLDTIFTYQRYLNNAVFYWKTKILLVLLVNQEWKCTMEKNKARGLVCNMILNIVVYEQKNGVIYVKET